MTLVRRLVALAGMPRRRLALVLALGSITIGCGIGLIATAGYLISRAAEQPPILSLTVTIVVVRVFGLTRPLARYFERLSSHDLALRALGRIRARFFARIEQLAPAQLEGFRRGDLLSRMVADVDALQGLYLRGMGPPIVALIVSFVSVGVTAVMLPPAGAILAVGLIVAGVAVPAIAARLSATAGRRQTVVRGRLTGELVELLQGAPELVVYGHEARSMAAVRSADGELARLARRDALLAGSAEGLLLLVTGLTVTAVLGVAVSAASAGQIDRVFVATLPLLALASFEAVSQLPSVGRELPTTLAAGRRVAGLMDRRPVIHDPDTPAPPPATPVVALENVTARYGRGAQPVLRDLSLRLEPGARVALVGPSGAGKTTVTNLLLRFLDPARGRITIAGRDVREYRQEDVRRLFALAGQGAHVFNSTIRENLLLARPAGGDIELADALRRARLADWVASLPDGLDTLVGEQGAWLSGGQHQRLVLARALLADAPVLILDEPTAHLDPDTAEDLIDDIFAAHQRSILLITHRPEGLDMVDETITLTAD